MTEQAREKSTAELIDVIQLVTKKGKVMHELHRAFG